MGKPAQNAPRDHGGGLDRAIARHGGTRGEWMDLSTGINPVPYPLPDLPPDCWQALPDSTAQQRLTEAARRFWNVPEGAAILAAPGASALIARIPALIPAGTVRIDHPTYNEHAAAFDRHGWRIGAGEGAARVVVNPNNPTGAFWDGEDDAPRALLVIDESFCDLAPERSLIRLAARPGVIVLKSFGKFWGLGGLRLGFAIGDREMIGALEESLGPWPVSGPALAIGRAALSDVSWAAATRARLAGDAARLDRLIGARGGKVIGGTDLFRLYDVGDASQWQERLARARIWSRIFPWSRSWLRLGLPGSKEGWRRLEGAL